MSEAPPAEKNAWRQPTEADLIEVAQKVVVFHEKTSPWVLVENIMLVLSGKGSSPFIRANLEPLDEDVRLLVTSATTEYGDTLVTAAAKGNDVKALQTLLELKADPNARTPTSRAPLFDAVAPFTLESLSKLAVLLRAKADPMLMAPETQLRPLEHMLQAVLPLVNTPNVSLPVLEAMDLFLQFERASFSPYCFLHDLTSPLHIAAAAAPGRHTSQILLCLAANTQPESFNTVVKDQLILPRTLARKSGYSQALVQALAPRCVVCGEKAVTFCGCNGPYCYVARYCKKSECVQEHWKSHHMHVCSKQKKKAR